jgi:hypothetical protein
LHVSEANSEASARKRVRSFDSVSLRR